MKMATQEKAKPTTFKEFLENVPPGRRAEVPDAFSQWSSPVESGYDGPPVSRSSLIISLRRPELSLYCEECKGVRFFHSPGDGGRLEFEQDNYKFIRYVCRNCEKSFKSFAIKISPFLPKSFVWKFGEDPPFGPPTPPRAVKLIGPDKELFFAGRRAESQGMGIGAFAYYRRIIENQKNRIFDEIIKATNKIAPGNAVIKELEKAKGETQFIKAVETISHALPESLLINGQNPLKLLHSALSRGLHDLPDDECLELASDIRTVLFEFADTLGQALEEKAELDAAVKRISKKGAKKGEDS
jgi:hypothetical protein